MSAISKIGKQLSRKKWYFILGVPILVGALAPFPGLGLIYAITDRLRGHPEGQHGTQPQNLAGLWIRRETVMYDFAGQSFFLSPDGKVLGFYGMTRRHWHYDNDRLFIDAVSGCGNCYRGNVTSEHKIQLLGPDQLLVTRENGGDRGVAGVYTRVQIDDALKSRMSRLAESQDENERFNARMVLKAIEQYEFFAERARSKA